MNLAKRTAPFPPAAGYSLQVYRLPDIVRASRSLMTKLPYMGPIRL